MSEKATAYIGLGANLGDREGALRDAIRRLGDLGRVTAASSFYETEPVGYLDQPPFLNAVVALQPELSAPRLLRGLLEVEQAMGRQRTFRNAPRTIDLDLLLYDDLVLEEGDLVIPHPRLHERAFVLVPLVEIAPEVIHPRLGLTVAALLDALPDRSGVRRVVADSMSPQPLNRQTDRG